MSIVFQVVVAVFVFGLLIFIHELGHFTVGKLSGMRVNEFALGMGPAIWSTQRGETKYALRALPIGGYVAVEGEDEDRSDPRAYCNVRLWKRILFVCAGALMNLLLGFVIGWVLCKLLTILCAAMDRRKTNRFFKAAQIFGAAAMSFMHGAQDGQKFIGVLFLGMAFCNGQPSVTGVMIPIWLMILCSTIMGVGTSVGGERIIKSVGQDMVKLEKYQGFSADLSSALCLLVMTVLGIPVSTTHTKTSAIMGVGAVRRLSAINFGVVRDMMLTWVFTFPGCGLISFVMAKLFMVVF